MTYYPTLAEDLKRAKEILARGRASLPRELALGRELTAEERKGVEGGTIYGGDTFAAYKLLESFVESIEHYQAALRVIAFDDLESTVTGMRLLARAALQHGQTHGE